MRDGRRPLLALGLVALLASAPAAPAVQRFPQPDCKSGYRTPMYTPPVPDRPAWREWANAAALSGALGAAAWLALRRRSRRGVWMLTVLCLVWFGLVRKGCVCPVGSIQNIAVAPGRPLPTGALDGGVDLPDAAGGGPAVGPCVLCGRLPAGGDPRPCGDPARPAAALVVPPARPAGAHVPWPEPRRWPSWGRVTGSVATIRSSASSADTAPPA